MIAIRHSLPQAAGVALSKGGVRGEPRVSQTNTSQWSPGKKSGPRFSFWRSTTVSTLPKQHPKQATLGIKETARIVGAVQTRPTR